MSLSPISILIPAFNELSYCQACIASIERNTHRPYQLILVDNGSTDGVGAYFDSVAGATVVHTGRNLGFAAGVNAGLPHAAGHVVLLNSDTLVTPGWLDRLEAALLSAPDIGLAGPRTNCARGKQEIDGLVLDSEAAVDTYAAELAESQSGKVTGVTRLVGFCLMIRADVLAAVGSLDEQFETGNFEDDDYCTRVRQAGFRLVMAEDCFVFHHGGRTFAGMGLEGAAFDALLAQNRARYAAKWDVHVPAPVGAAARAKQLRETAEAAMEEGHGQDALKLLREAVQIEPGNADNYVPLGHLLYRGGKAALAYDLAMQALKLDRWHAPAADLARAVAVELGKLEAFQEWMRAQREGRMIYFLCPDHSAPSGGIRAIYRQVDILNAAGIPAAVLHNEAPFRCDWFRHNTRITWLGETQVTGTDIVVLPEIYGPFLKDWFCGAPRVIFNQNVYNTFDHFPWEAKPPYPYEQSLATLVVSDDNLEYMRHAFPDLRVRRIRYSIDPSLYFYGENKHDQICFMPRKNESDARQVIHMLRARGIDLPLAPIDGRTAKDAARIMRESRFFLSFGHPEGFGLPAAEAMACGCIVVGYHGMGGGEFLRVPYAYPIEFGDIVAFSGTVEALIAEDCSAQGRMASAFILGEYTEEAERESVLAAWQEFLEE